MDLTNDDLLLDKMKINIHMLRALILNEIGGEIHDADCNIPYFRNPN
jgi:hypothetical protein